MRSARRCAPGWCLGLLAVMVAVPAPVTGILSAQEVPYTVGEWDRTVFGNHRAVVRVDETAPAVRVTIPWRRRDADPATKKIIVVAAATGAEVANVVRVRIERAAGELVFEPVAGAGEYHVYYLPYLSEGRNYPRVSYPPPSEAADPAWVAGNRLMAGDLANPRRRRRLPEAETVEIQAVDAFHSFWSMEVIATRDEVAALSAAHADEAFLVFPEDREHPIRMTGDLPLRWIERGPGGTFAGRAQRGEFFSFQLGVYAHRAGLDHLGVAFSDLTASSGRGAIPATALRCFNLGGVDWTGRVFSRDVSVEPGRVQALWCGVAVPRDIPPGSYHGTISLQAAGLDERVIPILIEVGAEEIEASGDDEPQRLSRLRWLDSTIALNDEPVSPYEPVHREGRWLSVLGRRILIGDDGLPERIVSNIAPEVTHLVESGRDILAGPLAFVIEGGDGRTFVWEREELHFVREVPGLVAWTQRARAGELHLEVNAHIEFDGTLEYTLTLAAEGETAVSDIRLELPYDRDVARYMMGMGHVGGVRPEAFDWTWDAEHNQDSAWLGEVNAGLQFVLYDDRYERPLNTNFYQLKPLIMPLSWSNEGRGGCRMREREGTFLVSCFSGPRTLQPLEQLVFCFRLAPTPFRPIDTDKQWRTRFYHRYSPVEEVAAAGASVINVHHATGINPYINYPFLRPEAMRAYVDSAHALGMKVKIYYTVRELANRAPELPVLFSLGHEIFAPGSGGGYAWLQEHLDQDYIAGWFVPRYEDAAVVTSGVSRWHNYYLEGLDWLMRKVGIDGLYIDDVAFDRTVMKRVRRILESRNPGALIDLHSANQFNPRDGFANSANLYLEHFPYLDRLWFGEYFDYDAAPDYWLVEVSGIPFGLMGEMLEGGGNPWRGLLFGMTNRLPYGDNDPSPLWRVWDDFRIRESEMIGWWTPDAPATTGREDVLATCWVADGRVMVAVASWAEGPVEAALRVDWERLGLDPAEVTVRAPAVPDFQVGTDFPIQESGIIRLPIEPGEGWLLIIR